ncbi:MAG TPA: YdeI/OmpD-associated family protein [Cyclobacteriaceae bacterium]|nr:YdeI/OmpD-associated family protein [Cyclobacteriaceae bacterium]
MLSFKTKIFKLQHLAGHYIDIPASVVKKAGWTGNQRFICTINKGLTWKCGLVSHGAGKAYILLNKKLMQSGKLNVGQEINVVLKKDASKYGMDVPVELKELFAQDHIGKERFDGLVPGKRRYIIYYINQVKSADLRIERAVRLIANLKKLPVGKESFKGLLAK